MKKIMSFLGVVLVGLVLFACAPGAAPAETATPGAKAKVGEKTGWEAQWEKVLQEGRKEGVVYVYGPPLPELRVAMMDRFSKAYPGIRLDYIALSGGQIAPRVKAEHGAGIYNVDMVISGTSTILTGVREFAQPIKPFLILPEVTDPGAWMGGKLDFADKTGEINLVFTFNTHPGWAYNSDQVQPGEITSWLDFAKPKWKGKIIMWDPTVPGGGGSMIQMWHGHKDLGPDFFKAFVANDPVITRDTGMQAETIGRGKYALGAGANHPIVLSLQKAGLPIRMGKLLKEGSWSTASFGSVAVMNKLPNPNAATVFLNWLLGKEGQTIFTTEVDYFTRRTDVSRANLDEAVIPDPNAFYFASDKEEPVMQRLEVIAAWNRALAAQAKR